jgi:hypothetical protein
MSVVSVSQTELIDTGTRWRHTSTSDLNSGMSTFWSNKPEPYSFLFSQSLGEAQCVSVNVSRIDRPTFVLLFAPPEAGLGVWRSSRILALVSTSLLADYTSSFLA